MPNGLAGSAQVSYPLQAPSGTAGAPSYSFAASPTTGMYRVGGTAIGFSSNGVGVLYQDAQTTQLASGGALAWSSGVIGAASDVVLWRDAANVLAQRNSTNPQAFRVYNTYTDGSNYERAGITWSANVCYVGTVEGRAGTGQARTVALYAGDSLYFFTAESHRWSMNASGHFIAVADDTYDIGASGATRPRNVYVGSAVIVGGSIFTGGGLYHTSSGSLVWTADGVMRLTDNAGTSFGRLCFGGTTAAFPAIKRDGANLALVPADGSAGYIDLTVHDVIGNSVYLSNLVGVGANNTNIGLSLTGFAMNIHNSAAALTLAVTGGATLAKFAGDGYLEMYEVTAPAAPGANAGRLYFEDNGAGKTRLMCLFGSGSAQQLAIEP